MRCSFVAALGVVCSGAISFAVADQVSYDRDIQPILSRACFQCHGPDETARKAKLRLDVKEAAFEKREHGAAIVARKPDESLIIQRITSANPDDRMPPARHGEPLTEQHIALIRKWIETGAAWSTHWAFTPPTRPAEPSVTNAAWISNSIDNFVLARLEKDGMQPSPEADRTTLIRRLYLDIIGLPPSPEELAEAQRDTSDGWYNALVEKLLASPHYGERWARHWMDAAQYADSDGFEKDKPRFVWAWRDWVINAFNENKAYDQFVIEQVAGDMLPKATQDQMVATGFLRNSMINEEGGIDPEQFRMEAQFNRMDIIGRAVLGLTVQCAQCHTHKYDPLTQTEYYRMMSFLNNEDEACITVLSADERKERENILKQAREVEEKIKKDVPDWRERMAAWETEVRALPQPKWESVALEFDDTTAGGQKCISQGDNSYLAQGYAPTQFQPKMWGKTALTKITAVRLELLPDANLPRGGPGRSIYGTAALSEFEMRIAPDGTPIADWDKWTNVEVASAIADVNAPERPLGSLFHKREKENRVTGPIAFAIDGKAETAWTTDIEPFHRNEKHEAIFTLKTPLEVPAGHTIAFRPAQQHGGWNSDDNQNYNLGRFRFSVTDSETLPSQILPERVQKVLAATVRSEDDERTLFAQWRQGDLELFEANRLILSLLRNAPSGTTQLVLKERETPRMTHRLERGDFLKPAEEVQPGVPDFLNALNVNGTPMRLDFAKWLVSRDSPTAARSFVNRVWQHYFGQGIVATSSDLGTQGDLPTHPDLLDWLAVNFMDSGWDVKQLHRLIVSSSTYKQASKVTPEALERDPYNKLLARGSRYRLEGEVVRDVALAASGLLNTKVGGPSVYPPAPEYLFQPPASYGPKTWTIDTGDGQYRRGLYTFRFRSVPYPALQVFDTPVGDAPCTRRVRSNTPLQALTTLNEPLYVACARGLAQETLAHGGATAESRIAYAFLRCTSRAPQADEVSALSQFLQKQQQRLAAGELASGAILASNDSANASTELAAWTLTARAIMNLDEAITRQ